MTHDELIARACDLAWARALYVHCCLDGRRCEGPGLPDLLIAGPGGLLFREVKTGAAPARRGDQKAWIRMLRLAGADVEIWYQEDFYTGRVERQLDLITGRPAR